MKMTKKKIEVEIAFEGVGKVIKTKDGMFMGGVPAPKIAKHLSYVMYREVVDEDGNLAPPLHENSIKGAFQINITANSKGFRELGKYFLSLAELDTSVDKGFHEHLEGLKSSEGRTQLHIILRKNRM